MKCSYILFCMKTWCLLTHGTDLFQQEISECFVFFLLIQILKNVFYALEMLLHLSIFIFLCYSYETSAWKVKRKVKNFYLHFLRKVSVSKIVHRNKTFTITLITKQYIFS